MRVVRDKAMPHNDRRTLDEEIARTLPITLRVFLFMIVLGIINGILGAELAMLISG